MVKNLLKIVFFVSVSCAAGLSQNRVQAEKATGFLAIETTGGKISLDPEYYYFNENNYTWGSIKYKLYDKAKNMTDAQFVPKKQTLSESELKKLWAIIGDPKAPPYTKLATMQTINAYQDENKRNKRALLDKIYNDLKQANNGVDEFEFEIKPQEPGTMHGPGHKSQPARKIYFQEVVGPLVKFSFNGNARDGYFGIKLIDLHTQTGEVSFRGTLDIEPTAKGGLPISYVFSHARDAVNLKRVKTSNGAEYLVPSNLPTGDYALAITEGNENAIKYITILSREEGERRQELENKRGVQEATYKILYQPPSFKYPPEAKKAKIQGTVVLTVVIGKDGLPIDAIVEEGPQELREEAQAFARQFRFSPPMLDGVPRVGRFKLSIPFRLRN